MSSHKSDLTIVGGLQCGDCDDAHQALAKAAVDAGLPPPPKLAESLRVLIAVRDGWTSYDQLIMECQRCGGFVGRFTLLEALGNRSQGADPRLAGGEGSELSKLPEPKKLIH